MIPVQFGEWLPDQVDLNNPGLTDCKGVYPSAGFYTPIHGISPTEYAGITGRIMGAERFERDNGQGVTCFATTSHIGTIIGADVREVPHSLVFESDGALTDMWRFEQFNSFIFATTREGATFYLPDIEAVNDFTAADASVPVANAIGFGDDFLFFGDIKAGGTDYPYRYQWSPYNSPLSGYGTDIATQAGFATAPAQFGPITGISGGEVTLLLQRFGVSRLDANGSATVFSRSTISQDRGCASPASVAKIGQVRYWISHDGFCRCDGTSVEVISPGKVWDWFLQNADMELLSTVQHAVNYDKRCIVWNFYPNGQTTYGRQIIYNYEQNRWSYSAMDIDHLVPFKFIATHVEGEPRKNLILAGFQDDSGDSSFRVLDDDNLEAVLTTGEAQLIPGQHSFVREVYPMVENTDQNSAVQIGVRDRPGEDVTYTAEVSEGPHGYCPVNASGRFFRTRLRIPAGTDWDKMQGVQIEATATGPA